MLTFPLPYTLCTPPAVSATYDSLIITIKGIAAGMQNTG
jgi:hypothetical protein